MGQTVRLFTIFTNKQLKAERDAQALRRLDPALFALYCASTAKENKPSDIADLMSNFVAWREGYIRAFGAPSVLDHARTINQLPQQPVILREATAPWETSNMISGLIKKALASVR